MCGEDPNIVFPPNEYKGMIEGYVEPMGVKAKVYLYEDSLLDSTTNGLNNGHFFFSNVPYGTYKLKFVADSFTTISQIFHLSDNFSSSGIISLEKRPSQILIIDPEENSTISYLTNSCFSDTMFNLFIRFDKSIPISRLYNEIKVTPDLPFNIIYNSNYDDSIIRLCISSTLFFKQKVLSFTIHGEIQSDPQFQTYFDHQFNLFPDTSQLKEAVRRQFFTAPYPSALNNTLKSNNSVSFTFRNVMDHQSVEKSIHLEPESSCDFIWTKTSFGEELGIMLSNPVKANSTLAVTFDTTMMTKDSIHPELPLFFTFKTVPLYLVSAEPNYFNRDVNQSFKYIFNLPVDSASFCNTFSLTPKVDSINVIFSNNYKNIEITHKPLINNTTYTISIDTSVTALNGEKLSTFYKQKFYTNANMNKLRDLIYNTIPVDTFRNTSTSQEIQVNFTTVMKVNSVEERFSITPAILTTFSWEGGKTLKIKPMQPFKAQTLYTAKFDSGFTSADNDTGISFLFSFKTAPVQLTQYFPYNEETGVSPLHSIDLAFNTEIDSAALYKYIQFTPAVDSISIFRNGNGFNIVHTPFLKNTEYIFIISDQLTDLYGVKSGKEYKITFKTAGN
jgi:hypothetical protein